MSKATRRQFLFTAGLSALAVRRLGAQGTRVRTLAGTGAPGYSPTTSDALKTPVTNPYGVVPGPDGALYFCEVDTGRILRLDLRSGSVTTLAGTGEKGYSGDGGPTTAATLAAPHELRFDRDGHLFIVERDNHVVRRIDAGTGIISTVAGTGVAGFGGDGGPAVKAQFRQPHSIAFDSTGRLLVCDIGNSRVRRIDLQSGIITTFAGTGERGQTPDDAPLEGVPLNGPRSLDVDSDGRVYLVLREGNAVFRIDSRTNRITRVAGTGATGFTGDGGPALQATFNGPKGIAWSSDGSLIIVDTENHAIRRVDLRSGVIDTLIGTGERGDGPDGDPRACRMARPHGVCFSQRTLVVTDSENHRIRALS
jgi:DNA-binding beta-propeller fold protein YncE